jgi:hypothetical protein
MLTIQLTLTRYLLAAAGGSPPTSPARFDGGAASTKSGPGRVVPSALNAREKDARRGARSQDPQFLCSPATQAGAILICDIYSDLGWKEGWDLSGNWTW